jgi:hypothetical protein
MTATFPAKLLIEKSSQSLLVDLAMWTFARRWGVSGTNYAIPVVDQIEKGKAK